MWYTIYPCSISNLYIVSLYLLISYPSFALSPWVTAGLFSTSVVLFLFCVYFHLYYFLDSTYNWYHTVFVFLCLTLLSTFESKRQGLQQEDQLGDYCGPKGKNDFIDWKIMIALEAFWLAFLFQICEAQYLLRDRQLVKVTGL